MDPVGLLGVGVMGLTAGRKLRESGRTILAFDPDPGAQARARQAGMGLGASPADVAQRCPVVLLFLPGPAEVVECVDGHAGLLESARSGQVLVDLSTVDPGTTRRLAARARTQGMGYLDAPVLGRPARVGAWALPVGGEAADLARCRPILAELATTILHVGESGAGNTIKLLNQLLFAAINAMTAEMMAIAERVGVPPTRLAALLAASQPATVSPLFLELGKTISAATYDAPTFSVDLLCKDVRLAIQMAKAHGAPPLLAETIQFLNETAQARGLGAKDTAVMWQVSRAFWTRDD